MRRSWLLLGGVLLACARPAPPAPEPAAPPAPRNAELSVDLWRGFESLPATELPEAPRVEILLDATTSMRSTTAGGPRRVEAAREAAAVLVERLPDAANIAVEVMGLARRDRCAAPTQVAAGSVSRLRRLLATRLRSVAPAGEGSLPEALDALARRRGAALAETRVVVLTDLENECGGDLCAAAAAVVGAGARIELVLFGEAEAPACLAELVTPSIPQAASATSAAPLTFRVQEHRVSGNGGVILASGRTNGRPLEVPGGPVLLMVEMDPPALIGPLVLSPGTRTRVRILDFPALQPHVREWRWDVEALPSDTVAEAP